MLNADYDSSECSAPATPIRAGQARLKLRRAVQGTPPHYCKSLDMWPWRLAELEKFAPNTGPSRDNMISAFDR